MSQNDEQIGIIGGAGAMGRVVERYFRELGYQTAICDPKLPESFSLEELLDQCRLLYISVFPLEAVVSILEAIASRPDAGRFVILENSTIKGLLLEPLAALDRAGTSICATHPLCKADQPWKNQNVLLIPFGRNVREAEELATSLYNQAQMKIKVVGSFEEHDELMAVLQLVPHLILRVVSSVFSQLEVDLDLLSSAATANFKLFYLSFWRVLVQNPALSAAIIWRLLQQKKGQEIYRLLVRSLQAVAQQDAEELAESFAAFYDLPKLTRSHMDRMNLQGIVTLERLANLERRAVTIVAQKDRVGLLREILRPFDELDINLVAIDSHLLGPNDIRFDIGYDAVSEHTLAELRRRIEAMGHSFVPVD